MGPDPHLFPHPDEVIGRHPISDLLLKDFWSYDCHQGRPFTLKSTKKERTIIRLQIFQFDKSKTFVFGLVSTPYHLKK